MTWHASPERCARELTKISPTSHIPTVEIPPHRSRRPTHPPLSHLPPAPPPPLPISSFLNARSPATPALRRSFPPPQASPDLWPLTLTHDPHLSSRDFSRPDPDRGSAAAFCDSSPAAKFPPPAVTPYRCLSPTASSCAGDWESGAGRDRLVCWGRCDAMRQEIGRAHV